MSQYRHILSRMLLLTLALTPLGGCAEMEGNSKHSLPRVKVAKPLVRDVNDFQYFIGRTGAIQSVDLQAKVTGYLWKIDYLDGTTLHQDVKQGQRLFQVDPRPYQATLDQATGQLNLAKARLTLAIADYKRALDVSKTPGAISQQDVDKYLASEAEARAEVEAQQANVEAAQLNVNFTNITAEFDGRVSRNLVDKGSLVKQNETLLATIVTEDPIYVYVDVDDQTMLQVKRLMQEGIIKTREQGGKFPIDIGLSDEGNDFPHRGVLDYISNQLDPTTGTLQIRAYFSNPQVTADGPRLMEPKQFVRVRFSLGPKFPALLVPQAAIGTDQGKKYVLVVTQRGDQQDVVEYRPVRLGPEQPNALQVVFPLPMVKTEEGLQPAPAGPANTVGTVPSITKDDRVIIDGLQFAPRGKPVAPTELPLSDSADDTAPSKPSSDNKPTPHSHAEVPLPPAPESAEAKTIPPVQHTAAPNPAEHLKTKSRVDAEPAVPLPPAPAAPQAPAAKEPK